MVTGEGIGSLQLDGGDIVSGAHKLVIAPGATVTRTSGSIRGNLQKHIAPAAIATMSAEAAMSPLALTFEVGSASGYTPVDVTYGSVAAPGELTISTADGEHADAGASGMDVARDVNRWWALALDRAPDPSETFSATFHWLPGDLDPTSDYHVFDAYRKAGAWTHIVPSARAPDRVTVDGLAEYGDFAIGTPVGTTGVVPVVVSSTFLRMSGPNPFRASAAIAYGLRQSCHVRIAIYSVSGQRVRTLVDGDQPAGNGSARWDGRGDAGNVVPSGLYMARMDADGKQMRMRLCLLR
jgi:hypothetical protein